MTCEIVSGTENRRATVTVTTAGDATRWLRAYPTGVRRPSPLT